MKEFPIQIKKNTEKTASVTPGTSIFGDFGAFNEAYRMAEVLCKTQLIPSNFQNKPADVLVAIEYSRRLDVPPTAIMPHLYVINGRPSMSAQMLIGLVNRSGLFSRIAWDEGVDGTVEYSVNGRVRKVDNIYAVAKFKELSSGREYKSPRIDLKMALNSGWLTKNQSKWQELPQVMARYRSASMLIKTICPELALGMDFAEDAMDDSAKTTPTRQITINSEGVSFKENEKIDSVEEIAETQPSAAAKLIVEVKTCENIDDLIAIGDRIAAAELNENELERLRNAYVQRKKELTVENDSSAVKTPKRRGRKPASEKKLENTSEIKVEIDDETTEENDRSAENDDETRDDSAENHERILRQFEQSIDECNDADKLSTAVVEWLEQSVENEILTPEEQQRLLERARARLEYIYNA